VGQGFESLPGYKDLSLIKGDVAPDVAFFCFKNHLFFTFVPKHKIMSLAPIVLFVYNRLDHTQKVIQSLAANNLSPQSELYIYADAAKNPDALPVVNEVRDYLKSITGFKKVHIRLREVNLGVDENVILGVTEVIAECGRVIVLEDDLVTSPWFLQYMNDALDLYENEDEVACIHGYVYPIKQELNEVFFLKGADCWGWGTWKKAWDMFEPDGAKLLHELLTQGLEKEFDFDHTYPYVQALKDQASGKTACWDIRWYASAFLANKLTLYPGQSLVNNIGHDASGMHCKETSDYDVSLASAALNVKTEVAPDIDAYYAFAGFLRNLDLYTKGRRSKNWISRSFKQFKLSVKEKISGRRPK
jgi:hypothetical protein